MIFRLGIALAAALLYTGLGLAVSHVPPFGIDLAGRALAGEAPHLALFFTESCWWPALVALAACALALAAAIHLSIDRSRTRVPAARLAR